MNDPRRKGIQRSYTNSLLSDPSDSSLSVSFTSINTPTSYTTCRMTYLKRRRRPSDRSLFGFSRSNNLQLFVGPILTRSLIIILKCFRTIRRIIYRGFCNGKQVQCKQKKDHESFYLVMTCHIFDFKLH